MYKSKKLNSLTWLDVDAMDVNIVREGYMTGRDNPTFHRNGQEVSLAFQVGYNNAMADFHHKPHQEYQRGIAREFIKTTRPKSFLA